jgi:hypothetical protein
MLRFDAPEFNRRNFNYSLVKHENGGRADFYEHTGPGITVISTTTYAVIARSLRC